MVTIFKEEVLKIAKMSNISLNELEVDVVARQLSAVLSYAACVKEIATDVPESLDKNINVMREDSVVKTDSERILGQAVEREANYFVVPAIIENK
jgi:aspartyl/glutamyl-tRNA(Asn/Gln) amidotransferase C subunit